MTVITGFFGMNFDALPGLHSPTGFWLAVLVMLSVVLGLLYFFKRRRWI
jgi:Mg2+ and Co2+ transporter CorA